MANYWRKRTPHDVILDCRMTVKMVLDTVRSYTLPYPCAILLFEKNIIRIVASRVPDTNLTPEAQQRLESGRILVASENKVTLKVADGLVELQSMARLPSSLLKASYVHPPTFYLAKHGDYLLPSLVVK